MKRLIVLIACAVALSASPALALFGWGKKDAADVEPPRRTMPPIPDEAGEPARGEGRAPSAEEAGTSKAKAEINKAGSGMPTEVVIKAEDGNKLNAAKPPLNIEIDPYESIRPSLKSDESMLLAVSPLTVSWRRTHPEFIRSERVIQPWRMAFSPRAGIVFRPMDQLYDVMQRRLEAKEAKSYSWNLTIADEEGRVFHHYEGSSDPPEELVWSGQNDQGEWIHAGRSYSAVYTFTDAGGSPRTGVAKPLLFRGIVHQEDSGLHISLDSAVLFGSSKTGAELVAPAGADLLRAASDLIKRRFTGIPISLRIFASNKPLGESQGQALSAALLRELMIPAQNIGISAAQASYSDQRVEIVLLNR